MAPTVFTYANPKIECLSVGIRFPGQSKVDSTFVFKNKVMSVDKRGDELLIFLTENQIIQLVELKNIRDTYDNIITWLSQ